MGRGAAGRRGYFATAWIFDARLATQRLVADLELSWGFGTINVAAMSVGLFLLLYLPFLPYRKLRNAAVVVNAYADVR